MDIYEDYVNEPLKKDKLSTIREHSFEESQSTRIGSQSQSDNHSGEHKIMNKNLTNKKHGLRDNLNGKMGKENFEYVYQYLRESRQQNLDEKKIVHHLKTKFGKDVQSSMFEIDQLIFFEDQNKM